MEQIPAEIIAHISPDFHHPRWVLEIVKRPEAATGFVLLKRRWVVERTFAWLSFFRRLSKDYEEHTETSETMVHISMIHLMVRRLAKVL